MVAKTRWGGIADGFRAGGFFRLGERDGVCWLIDPDGGRFLSKGVNTVRIDQDQIRGGERFPYAENCRRKYGGDDAWRRAAATRLAGWGFNTLGSWSDETVAKPGAMPLAVTPNLDLGMSFAWPRRQSFPDLFDPQFENHLTQRARDLCAKRSGEQQITGWFSDNELRWGPDWRGGDDLLTLFLNLPPASPGRDAVIDFLRGRRDFAGFNDAWRTPARSWDDLAKLARIDAPYRRKPPHERSVPSEDAADRADPRRAVVMADCDAFLALLAERYFALTCAALRAADANHLLLGSRFAYPPPRAVIEAAGRHVDVVSFNCYDPGPEAALAAYAVTGKPCLIGEFSFRGEDSGLPNTGGAGPKVATQTDRAASFRRYVEAALRSPLLVGYHWFEHADQPAQGRSLDGENSNFGTVTIEDRVYEELTAAMTQVNGRAEALHAAAREAVG